MSDVKPLDAGVTTSLDRMYRRHATWLRGRLRARVGPEEAGDVVQETYLRIVPYLLDDIRHPKALLLRVALNLVRDGKRRTARREGPAPSAFAAEAAGADAPGELLQVKQILLTMPPLYRDVFVMSRFDGMTYADIARAHGISLATVERRMAKAIEHCMTHLDG